jgi:hypothetical protein
MIPTELNSTAKLTLYDSSDETEPQPFGLLRLKARSTTLAPLQMDPPVEILPSYVYRASALGKGAMGHRIGHQLMQGQSDRLNNLGRQRYCRPCNRNSGQESSRQLERHKVGEFSALPAILP